MLDAVGIDRDVCVTLARRYYPNQENVIKSAYEYPPDLFLRLFITANGMVPAGIWKTHTYACYTDASDNKKHFFLIPMKNIQVDDGPYIRFENNILYIDDIKTSIYPQSIPHTTPFWYFHYNPNRENLPYYSMTLNLSPSCLERCVLCAGAKTGRVNNGMSKTLDVEETVKRIFTQHPDAKDQLDSVAIVTGCFADFNELVGHLSDVKETISKYCSPKIFRVLEHNVVTEEQCDKVVAELGYDVFVTLECFDQAVRNIALNGKVGRKGRNSEEFLEIIKNYSDYLEHRPELGKSLVHVTYLMGLDNLSVSESFFQYISKINEGNRNATVLPWLSIFTTYSDGMKKIQQPDFGLGFLVDAVDLCKKYFDSDLLANKSGSTSEGYARGLF